MPKILALETSSNACSVALRTDSGVVEDTIVSPREHTQRLLPMIEALMKGQNTSLADLDAIAYGAGPGSFTGLRICLSIAQGLAYGADLPLISISSLLAMAKTTHRLHSVTDGAIIMPVIDARMDEVYWSAYQVQNHLLQPLVSEAVSAPEQCLAYVQTLDEGTPLIAVGSGWQYPVIAPLVNADLECYASAYDVVVLASEALRVGDVLTPLKATPTYLRNEVSWKKRERIRQTF